MRHEFKLLPVLREALTQRVFYFVVKEHGGCAVPVVFDDGKNGVSVFSKKSKRSLVAMEKCL